MARSLAQVSLLAGWIVTFVEAQNQKTTTTTEKPFPQHICCLAHGPKRTDVAATLPMSLNHSASEEMVCHPLAGGKDKSGAVCDFCLCLHRQGEDLKVNP